MSIAITNGNLIGTPLEGYNKVSIKKNDITVNENFLKNSSLSANLTGINGLPPASYTTEFVAEDGKMCLHIHSSTLGVGGSLRWEVGSFINKYSVGQHFTFSGWAKVKNLVRGTTNYYSRLYYGGSYNNNGTSTWIGEGSRITNDAYAGGDAYSLNNQGWQHIYITSSFARKDYTSMSACYYLRDFTGDIYLRDFKMEIGDQITPWIPAISEGFSSFRSTITSPIEANIFYEK